MLPASVLELLLNPSSFEFRTAKAATPYPDFVLFFRPTNGRTSYHICIDCNFELLVTYANEDFVACEDLTKASCKVLAKTLERLDWQPVRH